MAVFAVIPNTGEDRKRTEDLDLLSKRNIAEGKQLKLFDKMGYIHCCPECMCVWTTAKPPMFSHIRRAEASRNSRRFCYFRYSGRRSK